MSRFVIFGSFSGLYKTWFAWLFLWLQNLVAFLRLILNSILAASENTHTDPQIKI
tara:strand:- start:71 stop:235 length:165 start_codon:yes stop_codon:yes gene_type:complete